MLHSRLVWTHLWTCFTRRLPSAGSWKWTLMEQIDAKVPIQTSLVPDRCYIVPHSNLIYITKFQSVILTLLELLSFFTCVNKNVESRASRRTKTRDTDAIRWVDGVYRDSSLFVPQHNTPSPGRPGLKRWRKLSINYDNLYSAANMRCGNGASGC